MSQEVLTSLPDIFILVPSLAMAFSYAVRKQIGQRDGWRCTDCGVRFSDGYMVHASHFNHDKNSPSYDTPEEGRIQCVDCHQQYHEDYIDSAHEIGLTEAQNLSAIAMLSILPREITRLSKRGG